MLRLISRKLVVLVAGIVCLGSGSLICGHAYAAGAAGRGSPQIILCDDTPDRCTQTYTPPPPPPPPPPAVAAVRG